MIRTLLPLVFLFVAPAAFASEPPSESPSVATANRSTTEQAHLKAFILEESAQKLVVVHRGMKFDINKSDINNSDYKLHTLSNLTISKATLDKILKEAGEKTKKR